MLSLSFPVCVSVFLALSPLTADLSWQCTSPSLIFKSLVLFYVIYFLLQFIFIPGIPIHFSHSSPPSLSSFTPSFFHFHDTSAIHSHFPSLLLHPSIISSLVLYALTHSTRPCVGLIALTKAILVGSDLLAEEFMSPWNKHYESFSYETNASYQNGRISANHADSDFISASHCTVASRLSSNTWNTGGAGPVYMCCC